MHMVNGAYTSQMDSQNSGLLTGKRIGDKFHRENGEVMQATMLLETSLQDIAILR